jgi:hypothetical protein
VGEALGVGGRDARRQGGRDTDGRGDGRRRQGRSPMVGRREV